MCAQKFHCYNGVLAAADGDKIARKKSCQRRFFKRFAMAFYGHKSLFVGRYSVPVKELSEPVEKQFFEPKRFFVRQLSAFDNDFRRTGGFPITDKFDAAEQKQNAFQYLCVFAAFDFFFLIGKYPTRTEHDIVAERKLVCDFQISAVVAHCIRPVNECRIFFSKFFKSEHLRHLCRILCLCYGIKNFKLIYLASERFLTFFLQKMLFDVVFQCVEIGCGSRTF